MEDRLIGEIVMFGGNFAPVGWLLCQGQAISPTKYPALANVLRATYGEGIINNFRLPDLCGRVPIGTGMGGVELPMEIGSNYGQEAAILSADNLPSHNHLVNCNDSASGDPELDNIPQNNFPGKNAEVLIGGKMEPVGNYSPTTDSTMNAGSVFNNNVPKPLNNMQPFLAVNFIIFSGVE